MTPFIASFFLFINMSFLEDLGSSLAFTILGVSVYMFGGYMFSGDLDIKSREFRRWGYLKFIWIPYQKLFEHRSVFTHGFILGTIIRILYVSIIPDVAEIIVYLNRISKEDQQQIKQEMMAACKDRPVALNFMKKLWIVIESCLNDGMAA